MLDASPYRTEFPRPAPPAGQPAAVCFNHAGVSPIPRRTAQKISQLAHYMTRQQVFRYSVLKEAEEEARRHSARLLQVATEQVAFVRNTSEGLSFVALGLEWQAGDEIVTTDQEFPSNSVVWLDIARRFGVTLHRVPSQRHGAVCADALLARVGPRTRVMTVSSVQFGSGAQVNLPHLGRVLQGSDTLLVVDAVQSLGVLPMEAAAWHLDVVAASGHKWLLAPEGCGLLYLSDKAMARVAPRVMGWHSVANAGDYHTPCITPRAGARRFEAGSPNILGAAALGESINLLLEVGMPTVQRRVHTLVGALSSALQARGFQPHTAVEHGGSPEAGMLFFTHPQIDTHRLHRILRQGGIEHALRQRGIRFSPHFYQDHTDIDQTIAILDQAMGRFL